jgi:hypothetical protein
LIPDTAPPETEKAMNYYLASQLVADRKAALASDLAHRALLKDARAARKACAVGRPARTRLVFFGRLAHAGA